MKKLILIGILAAFLAACSGNNAEKERLESIRIADSIAQVQIEKARLDSIRQDSIIQAEKEAINISLFVKSFKEPGFSRGLNLKSDSKISKELESLGFSVNKSTRNRYEEVCGEYQSWKSTKYTFTKTIGGETLVIEKEDNLEIIFPNEEFLKKFMETASKEGYKKSKGYSEEDGDYYKGPSDCYYMGTDIIVSGNTVKITVRWEC